MSNYVKIVTAVALLILVIAAVGFKVSVDNSVAVLQKDLDSKSKDSASLIALSLNGVDIESEIELVESLVKGAYNLGSFEEVTLYGRPSGDNQNLKMQNKKDVGENELKNSFFELKSSESIADITLDGEVQGKVLVKSDVTAAFHAMQESVQSTLKLFLVLAFGAIVLLAMVIRTILREPQKLG